MECHAAPVAIAPFLGRGCREAAGVVSTTPIGPEL